MWGYLCIHAKCVIWEVDISLLLQSNLLIFYLLTDRTNSFTASNIVAGCHKWKKESQDLILRTFYCAENSFTLH